MDRSCHVFSTLWMEVNLRRSSRDRSFHSFSGCPRSLEVSAIRKKFSHWTSSRKPWWNLQTNIMSPLSILQANESCFSNWALSSYSMSWRPLTSLVERLWTSSSSLMSFLSHGRQAWNEYSKWGLIKVPYNLSKSVDVILINDVLMALIIEFALLEAFDQISEAWASHPQ